MRPTRPVVIAGAALAVLVVAAGTVALVVPHGQPAAAADQPSPVATAPVERRTLSETVSQTGILTYRARPDGSPYTVIDQAHGTYTWLPAPGRVIRQGQVLYRVDQSPVVLLRGSVPAYRTLAAGASGADVAQLNTDLVRLGYASRALLPAKSAMFGAATAAAVERLQAAVGMPRTGTLSPGQVVFEPVAVRVTSVPVQPGAGARPGETVLQGTSSTREVQVALDASQQTALAIGDKVSIALPNDTTTTGVVSSMPKIATCPPSSGAGGSGGGTDACASGSDPTVTVGITPSTPHATGTWDQAPVQVGITTGSVHGALVVPVTALLAQSDGSYAVEVVGQNAGTASHLVAVRLGIFDDGDGLVQITGSGLAAGQKVAVASA